MFVLGVPLNALDVPCASLYFDWLCEFLTGSFPMRSLGHLVLKSFAINLVLTNRIELAADAIVYFFDTVNYWLCH